MKKSNKYFFLCLVIIIILSGVYGVFTRKSIKIMTYAEAEKEPERIRYQYVPQSPFGDGDKNNIISNLDKESNFIITGKFTGERVLMNKCSKSKVEITKIYKGNIENKIIDVYEPISINIYRLIDEKYNFKGIIFSNSGYCYMKKDKEYLMFLNNPPAPEEYKEAKDESRGFVYMDNVYSKINVKYNESDYKVMKSEDEISKYSDYENADQVFQNKQDFDTYKNNTQSIKENYLK